MSHSRHKTSDGIETEKYTTEFWSKHSEEVNNGDFWANRIKKYKGEPAKRLKLALENMPLPASFREAAIATRALIREKRKEKETYDEQLYLLYWLAAVDSFSIPYSEKLKEPGYNVIKSIPAEKLKTLPFSYNQLGYTDLSLLNKTDVKWLIENFGEPETHSTLHKLHLDVWQEYEDKLKIKPDSDPFSSSLETPESTPTPESAPAPAPAPTPESAPTPAPAPTPTPEALHEGSKNSKKLLFIIGGMIIAALIFIVLG